MEEHFYEEIIVIKWPASQLCMECTHGDGVISDALTDASYICNVGCKFNDGSRCPKQELSDFEEDDE